MVLDELRTHLPNECFHLTIYSDFHFPLAAMINDFRRSNISCHSRSFQHRMVLKSIRMEKSSPSRVDVFTNEIDKCCLANCLFVTIFDLTEMCLSFQMTNTVQNFVDYSAHDILREIISTIFSLFFQSPKKNVPSFKMTFGS